MKYKISFHKIHEYLKRYTWCGNKVLDRCFENKYHLINI